MIKVHEDEKNLCNSCRFSMTVRMGRAQVVRCLYGSTWNPPAAVTECRVYEDRTTPSLVSMNEIAWVLLTDKGKKIGFMRPEELRASNQYIPSSGR